MTDYYQIGPVFDVYYHLLPTQGTIANEDGAGFVTTPDYDNARIPEIVPRSGADIMQPSGFKRGDPYQKPPTNFLGNGAFINPFVIGWGYRIGTAYWVEIDLPFDWSPENYLGGVFEELDGKFDSQRRRPTGELNPDGTPKFYRVFVWTISLEFDVSIPVPVKRDLPPVRPEKVTASRQTFDAGEIIPFSKGARPIDGVKIWIEGIESGDEVFDQAASASWAEAYGYCLNESEEFEVERLVDNDTGAELWNIDAGTVLAALGGDLDFVPYYGTSTQMPDPSIVADKGAARTPAHRGLIYIVFNNVNLEPFGNRLPSMRAEFRRVDGERITVSGALEDVGVLGEANVTVSGIDNEADGVVFKGMDPRAILEKYKDQYGYRIKDGDPVNITRRAVNDDLVIDVELTSEDFADKDASDPVVTLERKDETDLPSQIVLTFTDKSQNYQRRPQYARMPRFPATISTSGKSQDEDTDFIITAVEAVTLAFDMLWRKQTQRFTGKCTLVPSRSEIEEAAVLRVPTAQGQFVMDVARRTLQPDQTVELELDYLLAERGATLTADAGDVSSNTVKLACYFPQTIHAPRSVVMTDSRLWVAGRCEGEQNFTSVSAAIPTKISHKFVADLPAGLSWTNDTPVAYDSDYVYAAFMAGPPITIMRVRKSDRLVTMLVCPEFRTAEEIAGNYGATFADIAAIDGVLLIPTNGTYSVADSVSAPLRLVIVDLADFTPAGVSVIEIADTPEVSPFRVLRCDGIAADEGAVALALNLYALGTLFDYNILDQSLYRYRVSTGELSDPVVLANPLGRGAGKNGLALFMPPGRFGSTIGASVDLATLDVTEFDVTDDSNVTLVRQWVKPWATSDHLLFLANNPTSSTGDDLPVNAPYLARRALPDLSVVTGRDLTFDFDNTSYGLEAGVTDGTWHYLTGLARSGIPLYGPGYLVKVNSDMSIGVPYPARQAAPSNDNFPGASIKLETTRTFYNEFATKEDGEPDHAGNQGGHSLWWTFTAPTDGYVEVTVDITETGSGEFDSLIAVYAGDSFASMIEVGSSDDGFVTFAAYAGTRYRIAVDGAFDEETLTVSFGQAVVDLTAIDTTQNDNFANAISITAGQTKTGKNRFATKEMNEPDHGGNAGGKSLWWKFTATTDTNIQITSTCDFPSMLAVYTEGSPAGVGGLVEVDSDIETGATDDDYAAWAATV